MLHSIRNWIQNPTQTLHFPSIINPMLNKKNFTQTLIIRMSSESKSKRQICSSCTKPINICLCNRIQTPGLENPVSITILQHSLEKKHPLNSARIAKLGLKNVAVVNVTDVNFDAHFEVRLLDSCFRRYGVCENVSMSSHSNIVFENVNEFEGTFECRVAEKLIRLSGAPLQMGHEMIDDRDGQCSLRSELNVVSNCEKYSENEDFVQNLNKYESTSEDFFHDHDEFNSKKARIANEDPVITARIEKYGYNGSVNHHWSSQIHQQKPNFIQLLDLPEAFDSLSKGFMVKKFQKRQLNGSIELDEYEEFELQIPPESILLFPSDESISVEALKVAEFKVKNLIVLDGTWAKAKRMYSENPWLKLLPHLKLDLNKMSLYSEVRNQPKAGYLSTIESIVYALKALGDDRKGLDNLLDVFQSMVQDQRRCKNERFSKVSSE